MTIENRRIRFLCAVVFFVYAVVATPSAFSQIVFQDNFDSHADWENTAGASPPTGWDSASPSISGQSVIAADHRRGSTGKGFRGRLFYTDYPEASLGKNLGAGNKELYFRWYMKFGADMAFQTVSLSPGPKLLRIASNWPWSTELFRFGIAGGGFYGYDVPGGNVHALGYTFSEYNNGQAYTGADVWRCIEVRIKATTTLTAPYNGIIQFWIDGDLKSSVTTARLVNSLSDDFVGMGLPGNFYKMTTDFPHSFYIDDIIISTEYIGEDDTTPTLTIPGGVVISGARVE